MDDEILYKRLLNTYVLFDNALFINYDEKKVLRHINMLCLVQHVLTIVFVIVLH